MHRVIIAFGVEDEREDRRIGTKRAWIVAVGPQNGTCLTLKTDKARERKQLIPNQRRLTGLVTGRSSIGQPLTTGGGLES